MKEIEERNKELLEKINEGRLNKIEKVEVYKHDEFDDVPQKEEKTKGQEFAEHLKRQFAALDDEALAVAALALAAATRFASACFFCWSVSGGPRLPDLDP